MVSLEVCVVLLALCAPLRVHTAHLHVSASRYISDAQNVPLFDDLGQVAPLAGYADLVTEIPFSTISDDLHQVCSLFTWFKDTYEVHHQPAHNFTSLSESIGSASTHCTDTVSRMDSLGALLSVRPAHREERQFGIGIAIAALASGIGGYFLGSSHGTSQSDNQLLQNQEHLLQVLRENEHITKLNSEHVETVRKVLSGQININSNAVKETGVFISILVICLKALRQADLIAHGIQALIISRKLSTDFIPGHLLSDKIDHLEKQANLKDYSLSISEHYELFECELSFVVYHNGTIRIITHIPVFSTEFHFSLFKYNSAPIN